MALKEDLKKSLVTAAKAKDQVGLDTVRSVQSALHYKEIEKRGELTEAESFQVIGTLCKQRREAIEQFRKGGREDLVAKETRELEILQKFLPQQFSAAEVEEVVRRVIGELGAKGPADMGKVMKLVMPQVQGRADGGAVNRIVKESLQAK